MSLPKQWMQERSTQEIQAHAQSLGTLIASLKSLSDDMEIEWSSLCAIHSDLLGELRERLG